MSTINFARCAALIVSVLVSKVLFFLCFLYLNTCLCDFSLSARPTCTGSAINSCRSSFPPSPLPPHASIHSQCPRITTSEMSTSFSSTSFCLLLIIDDYFHRRLPICDIRKRSFERLKHLLSHLPMPDREECAGSSIYPPSFHIFALKII